MRNAQTESKALEDTARLKLIRRDARVYEILVAIWGFKPSRADGRSKDS